MTPLFYRKSISTIVCWLLFQAFFLKPEAQAQTQYCTTNLYTNGCSANDRIDLFTFGTINNPTSTCGTDGYSDYTSISATVSKGSTYQVSMRSNAASSQGFGVWIDYNKDFDFDDAGEMVYSTTTTGTQVFSGSVLIPGTASTGATRLRVRSIRGGLFIASSSCTQFLFGETEDYTINIAAPQQYCTTGLHSGYCSGGTDNLITNVTFGTINNTTSSCPPSSRYSDFTNVSTTVQLGTTYPYSISTPSSGTGQQTIGIWIDYNRDFDFDDPGEFLGTDYPNYTHTGSITIAQYGTPGPVRMRIRSAPYVFNLTAGQSCVQLNSGETEDYTLNLVGSPQYCTLNLHNDYCAYTTNNFIISNVSMGGFTNSSGCGANGYQDFSNLTASLVRGQATSLSITANYTMGFGAWIDFNQDLVFSDDEFVYQSPASNTPAVTSILTLPATGPLGTFRMRVRAFTNQKPLSTQACTFHTSGETEDYSVTISAPPSPIDAGVTAITRVKSACGLSATETVGVILKNLGTTPQTNFPVWYSVNGTTMGSETITKNLAPGDTTAITFTVKANLGTAQVHTIKAWTALPLDAQPLNDTVTVRITNFGNGITSFPATETFESFVPQLDALGNNILTGAFKNGWYNATDDTQDWFVSGTITRAKVNRSASGDHTTGNGNYLNFFSYGSNAGTANLESPCITLTSLQTPTLEFWYHLYGGTNGSLAVDVNEGGNWNLNVYTLTGSQQALLNDPWLKAQISLAAYAGKSIRLRFRATIGSANTPAIAIDDIRILDLAATLNDVGVSGINKPTTTGCDKSATEEVCVNLTNFGNTVRKNFPVAYKINNLAMVSETFADSLLPGQTKQFCFSTRANLVAAGTYTLRAFSRLAGDQDLVNDTAKLSIINKVSMANFTFTNTTGSTFQFTTQYVNTGSFIKWYFGDGDSTTTMMPSHTYRAPGTYTVTMKAVDFQGCLTTVQKVVTVLGGTVLNDIGAVAFTKPLAGNHCSFTATEQVCVNLTNFGNVKQKNFTVSYKVNNQAIVTQQYTDSLMPNQTKQFCFSVKANLSAAGNHAIKAFTNLPNDLNRINDTARVSVTNKVPNLAFTYSINSPLTVLFTPQNLSITAPVKWYFGDGDSASTASPTHSYPAPGTYTVILKGTDQQGCPATVQQTVMILTTGLKEAAANAFKLYPNPATASVTLKFSDSKSVKEVEIVSVLGQKVKAQKVAGGAEEVSIHVQELPAGTYLVRITDSGHTFVKPLVIQK
ncbi:GEVED domain-containing protein [Adhaeribacter soli]|uniref:PKD domain-containing protein n=1 Tax=Adhaeribacter soli TaxID=2607655 RepID=A0A5N1J8F7_9BACT|nr:GEVED domain-containing protein [Adhaeribacter soli]KAA9340961.1 PKD domain-containing protein [Adhaeribacter soli]